MESNKNLSKIALLEKLCLAFGPSGCEDNVARLILENTEGLYDELIPDRMGGVIALVRGNGKSERRVMLSCHMDEVGFMVRSVTGEGMLKVSSMCGKDTRVLAGRRVTVGNEKVRVRGVFALKPIHLVKREDDDKAIPLDELYVDIGASSAEEAEKYVRAGDYGTFESDFVVFGENDSKIKCKALDDRAGCAILCDAMRYLHDNSIRLPFDLYFAFTRREEVGVSGARSAAHLIDPDIAIVFEATAVADIDGTSEEYTVAVQGRGPAVSLMDKSTVYDRVLTDFILECAKANNIPCQIKQYVSSGNDAGHIHRTRAGIRCAAVSLPARYIHTASDVISKADFLAAEELCISVLQRLKDSDSPLSDCKKTSFGKEKSHA